MTTKITIRASHRDGDGGRGVFAEQAIQAGELVKESPVLVIRRTELEVLESTILANYHFAWGVDLQDGAIALCVMSLVNHSDDPNTRFERDLENSILRFCAMRDIPVDEEITISYMRIFGRRR